MATSTIAAPAPPAVTTDEANALLTDFESVVQTHRPAVFRFALACLRDRDAAETVAQDCFWKAFSCRHTFRGECRVKTWLMRIAVNLVRDRMRSRKLRFWQRATLNSVDQVSRCTERLPDASRSPERLLVLRERVAAIWSAAGNLPEKQRCVFLLRFVEEMDILEIAAATGMKEGTVKTHLSRSLGTIRNSIGSNI